jgi:hypothetical protein
MFGFTVGKQLAIAFFFLVLWGGGGGALAEEPSSLPLEMKPEVSLYLEGLQLEQEAALERAAEKYQESLLVNPGFQLAYKRLNKLGEKLLTDHRTLLHQIPGYTPKPKTSDLRAIRGPIWFNDTMPGYLMIYQNPQTGPYALYSLKLRFMKNIHYLMVQEDSTWRKYPTVSIPGAKRFDDIVVYHQQGESLSEGFIQRLIQTYGESLDLFD